MRRKGTGQTDQVVGTSFHVIPSTRPPRPGDVWCDRPRTTDPDRRTTRVETRGPIGVPRRPVGSRPRQEWSDPVVSRLETEGSCPRVRGEGPDPTHQSETGSGDPGLDNRFDPVPDPDSRRGQTRGPAVPHGLRPGEAGRITPPASVPPVRGLVTVQALGNEVMEAVGPCIPGPPAPGLVPVSGVHCL